MFFGGMLLVMTTFNTKGLLMIPNNTQTFPSPICGQLSPSDVSFSFNDEYGYTAAGDILFRQMSTAPFSFYMNVDPIDMVPYPGICSLKVDWSC